MTDVSAENDSQIDEKNNLANAPPQPTWQRLLADAIRDPDELCDALRLPDAFRPAARRAAALFPLVVPRGFVELMQPGAVGDPLLLQILPVPSECEFRPGFVLDPLVELSAVAVPGMLRKYQSRALLIVSGVCAVNCRYCFRRSFPYEDSPVDLSAWQPAVNAIAADSAIDEVILSGGDPLTRTDVWLARLTARLQPIPHLKRLRVHTRLPIVLPERVTDDLIAWLTAGPLQPVVVVHVNHPNELGDRCLAAIRRLADAGITLLNQAVLLKGVNDSADVLARLSLRLFEARVLPYYLHQLDRVSGAGHFEVPIAEGLQIVAALRSRLPGYLVPQYVQEIPGQSSKTPITSLSAQLAK